MAFCAEEHAADEIGCGDSRGAFDDEEAVGSFDEAIAVLAAGVGGDIVAMNDVPAAVVGDPGE